MEIKTLPLGYIQANCYLLSTKNAAVVIDPGYNSEKVLDFLQNNSDKQRVIFLTHGHYDHIGGALYLRDLTDTEIAIGRDENSYLADAGLNLSREFGVPTKPFSADILLSDDEEISVGDLSVKVIATPGHTLGGVCYLIDNNLFSGDTLFCESIGRTDFPGGDFPTLENSIRKLYKLSRDIIVFPGHGPKTTIEHERAHNPYVRG